MVRNALFVAAAATIAVSASAQNWVFNGGFARDLRGWRHQDYLTWSPTDASNHATSGSLVVINPFQGNAVGVDQCMATPAIVPGSTYVFGGKAWIPKGQSVTGFVGIGLRWYPQPGCHGVPIDQPRAQSFDVGDSFSSMGWVGVAPAGTVSVEFTAYATKNDATGVFMAYIDDLYFGPEGLTAALPPPIFVPTGAHVTGYGGTVWRTDLEVHNPTQSSVAYSIQLLKRNQANETPLVISDSLGAGASRRYLDILFNNFGYQGGAALVVRAASGTLAATSRTFNLTSGGTYGQYVPGVPDWNVILYGVDARLVQLTHDLSTTTGYRTNIGFVNAVDMPITVEVDLYLADGSPLGTLTYDLDPFEFVQVDKVFAQVTASAVADGYAVLRTTTPNGRFVAYASVVDNATGDPVCVQPASF